jgi:hypothetical protein
MGLADRDYMRRPERPGPPMGGLLGVVIFILVLAALVFAGLPARSKFYKKHVTKPFNHFMKNLRSFGPYHKRKHGR